MKKKREKPVHVRELLVRQLTQDIAEGARIEDIQAFVDQGLADPDAAAAFEEVKRRRALAPKPRQTDPYADDYEVALWAPG